MTTRLRAGLPTPIREIFGLAGLKADQTVIVQPDDRIKEGTRIEAVSGR